MISDSENGQFSKMRYSYLQALFEAKNSASKLLTTDNNRQNYFRSSSKGITFTDRTVDEARSNALYLSNTE